MALVRTAQTQSFPLPVQFFHALHRSFSSLLKLVAFRLWGRQIAFSLAACLLAGFAVAPPASATEFLVNTITTNAQQNASVAALSGGGFVITWQDFSNGTDWDIRAQLYDANGAAQGAEFLVNTITLNAQQTPNVAALTGGGFVITWQDNSGTAPDTSVSAIRARRYDASGAAQGTEFLVNTTTFNDQIQPSIAALSNGGFVIAWADSSNGFNFDIRAQRYNASGVAQGTEFLVNSTISNGQTDSSIAAFSGGGFVIVWGDFSQTGGDTSSAAVRAQRFDASGVAQGAEFLVNTSTLNGQFLPSVAALVGGDFVIAWTDSSGTAPDTSGNAIRAQRFNASGVAQGTEFLVNSTTTASQDNASVAPLAGGGFVIAWQDGSTTGGDTSSDAIRAQRYDASGVAQGPEFLVNTTTTNRQEFPRAAGLNNGNFVFAWRDNSNGTDADIRADIFAPNATPTGAVVISGTPAQGQILTADASSITDADGLGTFSYQWKRSGSNIAVATGTSYTLTQGDVGSTITVTVSYTDGGGIVESLTSVPTSPVTDVNDSPSGRVQVSGTAIQGQTLSADPSGISDPDGLSNAVFTYQWRRGDVEIMGETAPTLTLTQTDVGATIRVMVRFVDDLGFGGSIISPVIGPIANLNDAPSGTVTITGTAVKGETLTADASGVTDIDGLGAFSYQWRRSGTDIIGASASTYTLVQDDIGKTIDVMVSYTDGFGAPESVTSAPTGTVLSAGTTLFSSVLPSARSGFIGGTDITVFASVNNAGTGVAQNCVISIPANAPVTLSYQETGAGNVPVGAANAPFNLVVGQSRSFILSFTPTATSTGEEVFPNFICDNANTDAIPGVNTAFLEIEALEGADILSIGSTPSGDGVINIPSGGTGFMTVTASNIGRGDVAGSKEAAVTVSVDTGSASLALEVQFCETNAASVCITSLGTGNINTKIDDTPHYFAVFVADKTTGTGVPLDPANARVFLRFKGANGAVRSVTSAAVTVPAAAATEASMASDLPVGRWAVMVRQTHGIRHAQTPGTLYVWPDGTAALHTGKGEPLTMQLAATKQPGNFTGMASTGVLAGQFNLDRSIALVNAINHNTRLDIWGVHDTRGLPQ